METEPASRFSPTTRLNDFSAAFTFKPHKLAMKLPPSLTRLWTRRPKILPARDESVDRSSAAAPEVDVVMGNPRRFPWLCLHLFVLTKSNEVYGHGEPELHTRQATPRTGGIDGKHPKVHGPAA